VSARAAFLEELITRARMELAAGQTQEARARAWAALNWLVRQRTPERVEQMELERGLRT